MIRGLTLLVTLLLWPLDAAVAQQITEATGVRALGMGGAFVGVADDSTAVYWNPAGLVKGPPAGMTVGWLDFRTGDQTGPPALGATSRTSRFVSLGTWPIGLSYGHFDETALTMAADGTMRGETLAISEAGFTIVQTLLEGLVIGSTVRYMRGAFISAPVQGRTTREALDFAASLDGPSTAKLDLDLGVMADFGKARLGLTVLDLTEPTFGSDAETSITLARHYRLGLAVLPINGLTLAVDLDLDTVNLRDGPRRILAMGGEDRIGRWAIRSGVRWSREGARRTTAAVGASFALRKSLWLDWQYTQGHVDGDRGYGVGLRAGS